MKYECCAGTMAKMAGFLRAESCKLMADSYLRIVEWVKGAMHVQFMNYEILFPERDFTTEITENTEKNSPLINAGFLRFQEG